MVPSRHRLTHTALPPWVDSTPGDTRFQVRLPLAGINAYPPAVVAGPRLEGSVRAGDSDRYADTARR